MKRIFAAILLCGLAACAGITSPPSRESYQAARVERGRVLAQNLCTSCHAIGPEGESPAPEAPAFRRLSKDFHVATLEGALRMGMSTGHPAMPVMHLPPEDVRALVAYLNSVQQRPH